METRPSLKQVRGLVDLYLSRSSPDKTYYTKKVPDTTEFTVTNEELVTTP